MSECPMCHRYGNDHAQDCVCYEGGVNEVSEQIDKDYEALEQRIAELEAYKEDVENATKSALDEKCTLDENHCTCVPLLRVKVRGLEAELEQLKYFNKDGQRKTCETSGYCYADSVDWPEMLHKENRELEAENADLQKRVESLLEVREQLEKENARLKESVRALDGQVLLMDNQLDTIEQVLDGVEPDDFSQSFPIIRKARDLWLENTSPKKR